MINEVQQSKKGKSNYTQLLRVFIEKKKKIRISKYSKELTPRLIYRIARVDISR